MAALVMLVLLVCACSLFCELFQRRLEEVVPLAACAIVLMMYAFALAGLLRAGALAALGLCAACLRPRWSWRRKDAACVRFWGGCLPRRR